MGRVSRTKPHIERLFGEWQVSISTPRDGIPSLWVFETASQAFAKARELYPGNLDDSAEVPLSAAIARAFGLDPSQTIGLTLATHGTDVVLQARHVFSREKHFPALERVLKRYRLVELR